MRDQIDGRTDTGRSETVATSPRDAAGRRGAGGGSRAAVRRVSVDDPVASRRRHDYADAFELQLPVEDATPPEEWIRAGVDELPTWVKWVANARDGFGSAEIVESTADTVVLKDSDGLMETVLVGRNLGPGRRLFTTVLTFRRPLLARAFWAVVGILHRRVAQRVVAGGV